VDQQFLSCSSFVFSSLSSFRDSVFTSDPHVDPIGAKGIGEIGMTGVAAAIANAVFHATGVRVRNLPITLDKLFPQLSSR